MQFISDYQSPLGTILLTADADGLTGLFFTSFPNGVQYSPAYTSKDAPVFSEVRLWLDSYFSGKEPDFIPRLHIDGSDFQRCVWTLLQKIPYGTTITYAALAKEVAHLRGVPRMAAQAVGAAVGRNRISIIIPCHRVVGKNGNLTGYGGGLDKKWRLLELEGMAMEKFFLPPERPVYNQVAESCC